MTIVWRNYHSIAVFYSYFPSAYFFLILAFSTNWAIDSTLISSIDFNYFFWKHVFIDALFSGFLFMLFIIFSLSNLYFIIFSTICRSDISSRIYFNLWKWLPQLSSKQYSTSSNLQWMSFYWGWKTFVPGSKIYNYEYEEEITAEKSGLTESQFSWRKHGALSAWYKKAFFGPQSLFGLLQLHLRNRVIWGSFSPLPQNS